MREAIFILFVVFLLMALTAFRYRRGVMGAWQIWRSFKDLQGAATNAQSERIKPAENETKLVRCARCGTWVPESRSIRMNVNLAYCSKDCLESKATAG